MARLRLSRRAAVSAGVSIAQRVPAALERKRRGCKRPKAPRLLVPNEVREPRFDDLGPVAGRFFHDIAMISGSCGHAAGFAVDAYVDPAVGRRLVRWPPPETVTPTAPANHRVAARTTRCSREALLIRRIVSA